MQYSDVSTCDYADALTVNQFMSADIRALWPQHTRLAGPAFTVECPPGDHLMLHAAIYRAQPGDILVVKGDNKLALAGGNVCAIAQQNGIKGMIVDGYVRDVAEITQMEFPVYARGSFPKPAAKRKLGTLQQTIRCGGVEVNNGDIVIADEDGVAVIPALEAKRAFEIALKRNQQDSGMTLAEWREQHLEKVQSTLTTLGFTE